MLTAERLRQVLAYCPETGVFRWKVRLNNNGPAVGEVAGDRTVGRHSGIGIDGRRYGAHRLAWLYVYGIWPAEELDHINRDPSDNRLVNLREATHAENMRNKSLHANNRSGFKGVHWHALTGKWRAQIKCGGTVKSLGLHATPELAYEAYCAAAPAIHGEFASIL